MSPMAGEMAVGHQIAQWSKSLEGMSSNKKQAIDSSLTQKAKHSVLHLAPSVEVIKGSRRLLLSWCKDYFAADVGHVRRRDSVVGSQSRGRARRKEGRPRSAIGDEERKREMRRAQNGTQ